MCKLSMLLFSLNIAFLSLSGCSQIGSSSVGAARNSEQNTQHALIGIWQVDSPGQGAEFITIGPAGSAIHSTRGRPDSTGRWESKDADIVIYWQNGWTDVITVENGVTTRKGYEPGSSLSQMPSEQTPLKRATEMNQKQTSTSWGAGIILDHCRET